MKTVRIGGVPEHFNYAWYIALKNNAFKAQGIDLCWVDCPGGTGCTAFSHQNHLVHGQSL